MVYGDRHRHGDGATMEEEIDLEMEKKKAMEMGARMAYLKKEENIRF